MISKCTGKVKFIYSGNNEFPFDAREQWTDSCNLLALKEGVVLGYDRNDKTIEAFKENGFQRHPCTRPDSAAGRGEDRIRTR